MQFVTADFHFDHENIIKYTGRPFPNKQEMNEALIKNFNAQVESKDTVFIVGDVSLGSQNIARGHLSRLNGHHVLIRGNHDSRSLTIIRSLIISYSSLRMLLMHDPSFIEYVYEGAVCTHELCQHADLVLCGHVHEKWRTRWYKAGHQKLPVINVGVDRWNYQPISLDTIVKLYKEMLKQGSGLMEGKDG